MSPPSTSSTVAQSSSASSIRCGHVALAAAEHQHGAVDLRRARDGLHRPRHHASAGQRQIRLVAVGADARPHPRGQHDADRSWCCAHPLTLAPRNEVPYGRAAIARFDACTVRSAFWSWVPASRARTRPLAEPPWTSAGAGGADGGRVDVRGTASTWSTGWAWRGVGTSAPGHHRKSRERYNRRSTNNAFCLMTSDDLFVLVIMDSVPLARLAVLPALALAASAMAGVLVVVLVFHLVAVPLPLPVGCLPWEVLAQTKSQPGPYGPHRNS